MIPLAIVVELFYNGSWQDITQLAYVRDGIRISRGRRDEGSTSDPGTLTLAINNRDGRFSPRNPRSPLFGLIGRNTPIRVTVSGSIRFTGEVVRWPQRWDASGNDVRVPLEAAGILRRLGTGAKPLESPLFRAIMAADPAAYWPLEDGPQAQIFASPIPGVPAPRVRRDTEIDIGSDPVTPGSGPSVRLLTAGTTLQKALRFVIPDGPSSWSVESCLNLADVDIDVSSGPVWNMTVRDSAGGFWSAQVAVEGETMAVQLSWLEGEDDPGTVLFVDFSPRDRGTFHQIRINAGPAGSLRRWEFWLDGVRIAGAQASGGGTPPTAVGTPEFVTLLASDPDGESGLIVGHVAVLPWDQSTQTTTWRAVEGWAGEPATTRFLRVTSEQQIPAELLAPPDVLDEFERTEVDDWGETDTDQEWLLSGPPSSYQVSGGVGSISDSTFFDGQAAVVGGDFTEIEDVDERAVVTVDGDDNEVGLIARSPDEFRYYSFEVSLFPSAPDEINIWLVNFGATLLATAPLPAGGQPWWIRVQCISNILRMKVWSQGTDEPAAWSLTAQDGTLIRGAFGCIHFGDEGADTATFDNFSAVDIGNSSRMGPEPAATPLGVIQEAVSTDHGILHETRESVGLAMVPLSALYNRSSALELDYEAFQVSHPFHPDEDDQRLANHVVARRPGGSTATATRTEGPLSTQEPPDGVGIYGSEVDVAVLFDTQLPGHAGWLLHIGTWDEARYPLLRQNLRASAAAALSDDILALESGARVDVTNLPAWLPPEPARLLIQGYDELASADEHVISFDASPYGPYEIAVVAAADGSQDARGQAVDTDHSTLDASIDDVTTSLSVATDLGTSPLRALWTTDPDDWDDQLHGGGLFITIGGEQMRVTDISGASSPQTFTVVRGTGGFTRAHDAGTPVHVTFPARIGL